ncbi:MAG: AhpC/TSA family protein [Rhodospirillaceae bacterium]|nr:AhpC/TSA family protein [Rhodospirillaceae bacterium]
MSEINALVPRQPVPALELPLVGGGTWSMADQKPENFTMVVFYRGLHCPICSRYLGDLNRKAQKFADKGVNVLVASSDDEDRATRAKTEWELDALDLAYGISLEKAREWGLYVSTSNGKTSTGLVEPDMFIEPGLYLIRADGTLYFGTVQTMPFARPSFAEILAAIDRVLEVNYPARGEVVSIA